jgi:hypothetical protein
VVTVVAIEKVKGSITVKPLTEPFVFANPFLIGSYRDRQMD